jgi:hypothetical protein
VIYSSNNGFEQPSDENAQGDVLSIPRMDIDEEDNIKHTPNKADAKPSADKEDQASPSPEIKDKPLIKHDDETGNMKKLFAVFTSNTQKRLTEKAEKHAIEIAAMKRTTI